MWKDSKKDFYYIGKYGRHNSKTATTWCTRYVQISPFEYSKDL